MVHPRRGLCDATHIRWSALTRARSPPCKNGLPIRVPRRPLFRTVAPYAQREPPGQRNNTRASRHFIPGTNAIESLNARYHSAIKARCHYPPSSQR
jgi:hypothetical protein